MTGAPTTPMTLRPSMTERIMVTLAAIFMGAIALVMLVAAVGGFVAGFLLGLFLLFIAAIMVALTWLVAKEAFSRWRLYAHLEDGQLTAALPRRRSFIDQPRDRATIALSDIERIETRHEAFASNGVATGQQAFCLVTRDGARVFLGADREWTPPFFARLSSAILERANAPLVDLGMVDGDAGFMLVAGQSTPDWATPSLPPAEISKRNKRRARTVALMGALALIVLAARFLARG